MKVPKRTTNYLVIMLILSVAYEVGVNCFVVIFSGTIGIIFNVIYDAIQEYSKEE